MIQKRTVLILGAGASQPYGFPTGSELVDRICALRPTYVIHHPGFPEDGKDDYYHESFINGGLEKLQSALKEARPTSIEVFLSQNPALSTVGRAAIATALIQCESIHNLLNAPLDKDWYSYLREKMGEDKIEFLESTKKLSIITFNYDRSLEYYFFRRLEGMHSDQGLELYRKIKIVHVYGQLGIPDFLKDDPGFKRPYIPKPDRYQISDCVSAIKIIADEKESSVEFKKAHEWLAYAKVICFIGFGYNEKNIERLQLQYYVMKDVRIFGSVKNITPAELDDVRLRFKGDIPTSHTPLSSQLEFGPAESGVRDYLRNSGILSPRD